MKKINKLIHNKIQVEISFKNFIFFYVHMYLFLIKNILKYSVYVHLIIFMRVYMVIGKWNHVRVEYF